MNDDLRQVHLKDIRFLNIWKRKKRQRWICIPEVQICCISRHFTEPIISNFELKCQQIALTNAAVAAATLTFRKSNRFSTCDVITQQIIHLFKRNLSNTDANIDPNTQYSPTRVWIANIRVVYGYTLKNKSIESDNNNNQPETRAGCTFSMKHVEAMDRFLYDFYTRYTNRIRSLTLFCQVHFHSFTFYCTVLSIAFSARWLYKIAIIITCIFLYTYATPWLLLLRCCRCSYCCCCCCRCCWFGRSRFACTKVNRNFFMYINMVIYILYEKSTINGREWKKKPQTRFQTQIFILLLHSILLRRIPCPLI